jgi:hypothetical protein
MPLIDEIKNTLLFISEMNEEEQMDIAESLSRRVVAYDYAKTMSFDEVVKLTELALSDLSRSIAELKRATKGPPACR